MKILIESGCTKKAYKKTKSIISRYLLRKNSHSWIGSITYSGLLEMQKELSLSARRNTSIICYSIEKNDIKLLWRIGNCNVFSSEGNYLTRRKSLNRSYKIWIKKSSIIASICGMFHDIGKITIPFQYKLRNRYTGDYIRHEIISLLFILEVLKLKEITQESIKLNWNKIWDNISEKASYSGTDVGYDNICEDLLGGEASLTEKAVFYIISSHHQLFDRDMNFHIKTFNPKNGDKKEEYVPCNDFMFSDKSLNKISRLIVSMKNLEISNHDEFRGLSLYSRSAMIAADHFISSQSYCDNHQSINKGDIAANTHTCYNNKENHLNQPIEHHLESVSLEAGSMCFNFQNLPDCLGGLIEPDKWNSSIGRFKWQDNAVCSVQSAREEYKGRPMLVFVNASTGSGKTIANLKIGFAASKDPAKVRLTSAFNLRSLTVQTGNEYKKYGFEPDIIIGDKVTLKVNSANEGLKILNHNNESVSLDDNIDTNVYSSRKYNLPEWTDKITQGKSSNKTILSSSLLVSTMDYIINAGNPSTQGKHILSLLRCMHSDLILDEIDSYNPKAISAICRVVEISAMFGRNVIVSSATTSTIIMDEIFKSFKSGQDIFDAMNEHKKQDVIYIVVNNYIEPIVRKKSEIDYEFCNRIRGVIKKQESLRIASVFKLGDTFNDAVESIFKESIDLHNINKNNGTSIGAIRILRSKRGFILVDKLNRLASEYEKNNENVKVHIAYYHANLSSGQRIYIENELEHILHRKYKENDIPEGLLTPSSLNNNPHIDRNDGKEHIFIVVCTPVIDTGRDFDFDWGILEPTSARVISQFSGRVNRHRMIQVGKKNISIMSCLLTSYHVNDYKIASWNEVVNMPPEENNRVLEFYQSSHDNMLEECILEFDGKVIDASICIPEVNKDHLMKYDFKYQEIDTNGQSSQFKNNSRLSHESLKNNYSSGWASNDMYKNIYNDFSLRERHLAINLKIRTPHIYEVCLSKFKKPIEYELSNYSFSSSSYGTEWLEYDSNIHDMFGLSEEVLNNISIQYIDSRKQESISLLFHHSYGSIFNYNKK